MSRAHRHYSNKITKKNTKTKLFFRGRKKHHHHHRSVRQADSSIMGAASKAHPIGDLLIIAVALATGIVWLLIGVDNHDLDCLRGATDIAGIPEMATWLIVEGAFLIGY